MWQYGIAINKLRNVVIFLLGAIKVSIKVFVNEEHLLVRTGLKRILANEKDIEVVAESSSGERCLSMLYAISPDVILSNFHLPGISGLELTRRLAKTHMQARVILLLVSKNGYAPRPVLNVGAGGYVDMGGDAYELVSAIRAVAHGKRYLSRKIAQHTVLSSLSCENKSPFEEFTKRELEVALMLMKGFNQKDIAHKLEISTKTVTTHQARVYEKAGVRNQTALFELAKVFEIIDKKTIHNFSNFS